MNKISRIKAREILDSRGNPTIEVDVILDNKLMGRASVPSGASTGSHEALELRDNDTRYHGKGVLTAVYNVNNIIAPVLIGQDVTEQTTIDKLMLELDGTTNKMKLGANAILAVSLACLKAAALLNNKELYEYVGNIYSMPYPMMNIINGGMHADSGLAFQEFMIIPKVDTISERIRVGSEIFHTLKSILSKAGYSTSVGDEGGFAPKLKNVEAALDLIMVAIKEAGYKPGVDVVLALDVAATSFYENELYNLNDQSMTSDALINYYVYLVGKYPIISIEDGLAEDDWAGWKVLTTKLANIQLVGDDLFVTDKELLQKGINEGIANAILIKVNQIGTISEMLETINLAKANNYKTIISHRSGETEDTFIADLAVGLNLGQIKTGSLSRTDRVSKYNELIRIEEKIKNI